MCISFFLRNHSFVGQKPWWASEDVSESTPRERVLKTVSFQESVSFITDATADMELESQQIQHGCLSASPAQSVDSEVVQVYQLSPTSLLKSDLLL